MTTRLDEIKANTKSGTISNIEWLILGAAESGRINLAYRAGQDLDNMENEIKTQAAKLLKLREEIQTLKELLYEAQRINMLSDGEGGGAWSVNGDLEERTDKALEGYQIED